MFLFYKSSTLFFFYIFFYRNSILFFSKYLFCNNTSALFLFYKSSKLFLYKNSILFYSKYLCHNNEPALFLFYNSYMLFLYIINLICYIFIGTQHYSFQNICIVIMQVLCAYFTNPLCYFNFFYMNSTTFCSKISYCNNRKSSFLFSLDLFFLCNTI